MYTAVSSLGQSLLISGTPGKRSTLPHASIPRHQPRAEIAEPRQTSASDIRASDIVIQARQFERLERQTAELTAWNGFRGTRSVTARFTAYQALAYRFIDRVVDMTSQLVPG